MTQERIQAFARLAIVAVALINALLTASGRSVLPWSGTDVGEAISDVLASGSILAAWWFNANITRHAGQAQQVLDSLKDGDISSADVQGMLYSEGK